MRNKTSKKHRKISRKTYKKKHGGAKTLNEVISDLKTKGKYNDWVSKGSSFTYKWPSADLKYTFIDANGKEIKGAYQGKQFRTNVESIPIFGQIFIKDPSMVNQGKFQIVNKNARLGTAGLATCSGLAMRFGSKKFLAHLDARTDKETIIEALKKAIESEGNKPPTNVTIYAGSGFGNATSAVTVKIAKDICSALGIPEKEIYITETCFMTNVKY